ncbi:MarR family winged helix-turn-helix transcriptional regulator [Tenacibaculum piscium]|uniref:HTH-type transcriptional regulator SarZ n=1 Tax=Tenacibaculum piscium TaxID=1458515 RepID=A0A2H1YIK2_9FLAO|nr:MarR family transcriptional regulator [Tenacibaculum piscium]MBE7628539.1 MarR family transcriptional regulator [Tenacibaculum piscium]MBE7669680.1 MarR family transcriptional regulator [Tenacibaculum piscium]SOS75329.1 DNA-binding transcriptional regulator, MarR family [Tenacibaculum piscium]
MIAEQLKLSNQFCFPIYATSRLIIKLYKPYLDDLKLTYTQYLVMLVLWEKDTVSVNTISQKLFLESNTLTPLLKRMETNGLLKRNRSKKDERIVLVQLTKKGHELMIPASSIPKKIMEHLENENISKETLLNVKKILCKWLD